MGDLDEIPEVPLADIDWTMGVSSLSTRRVPETDDKLLLDGQLLTVVASLASNHSGIECVLEDASGVITKRRLSWQQIDESLAPANDGGGTSHRGIACMWGKWMEWTVPRIRSSVLATKPLQSYAHQDTAVFSRMLPQPRLRFLLADEPGTGKTIMTGMYLSEARRRGLIEGRALHVVPAHLVTKWMRDLTRYFGVDAMRVTAEIGREPQPLRPDIDVWVVSLDLFTYNEDVRRKLVGRDASWSLVVFDEAHRLTPTSQYLGAAQQLAAVTHHLLLLTATPHRGNENFFRALLHLLEPTLYPWEPHVDYNDSPRLHPSELHFIRRMKEGLRDLEGHPLFPARYAETIRVDLSGIEADGYSDVMTYVDEWYPDRAALARSVYGKRAASSLTAARETLRRRRVAISNPQVGHVEPASPFRLGESDFADASVEDDEAWQQAERAIVEARTRDRRGELQVLDTLIERIGSIVLSSEASKWETAEALLKRHSIAPGRGQALVFTEFADTAHWLHTLFANARYTSAILEGATDHRGRDDLQQRFLRNEFQVLVSTDAGGEGIDLQSAHVMLNWDIPWSLVRLEQRMGRLHRIGQNDDVYVYHLVAPATREGRVQEVVLENLSIAADALRGRVFDLMDATATTLGFDYTQALVDAQQSAASAEAALASVPDPNALIKRAQELIAEEDRYRTPEDVDEAKQRFAADRLEAINPVMVEGFVRQLAATENWTLRPGPHAGILLVSPSKGRLPSGLGGGSSIALSADGAAVRTAWEDGVDTSNVIVLGPTEPAFHELMQMASEGYEGDLRRGIAAMDSGSLSDYALYVYRSDVEVHDGVRPIRYGFPFLVRFSGSEAFGVEWESIMTLIPEQSPATRPPPAARTVSEDVASKAAESERERLATEREAWAGKARSDLDDIEARYRRQIRSYEDDVRTRLRSQFSEQKRNRANQLAKLLDVKMGTPKLLGWVAVRGSGSIPELGFDPDSEKVAIAMVMAELKATGYDVDDRQTARVGYDLYARHRETGEQRLAEVKGQLNDLGPVMLEQHEWAQAQQLGSEYWLYLVTNCASEPVIFGRFKDPAGVFGGPKVIQRVQIPASKLRQAVRRD